MSFLDGTVSAFAAVLVSELGDKSFILAAMLSIKHGKLIAFISVYSALLFMTLLTAMMGAFATSAYIALPKMAALMIASAVFFAFGLHMLLEALQLNSVAEVSKNSQKSSSDFKQTLSVLEEKTIVKKAWKSQIILSVFARFELLFQIFLMTCVAEVCDKSQITTLLLGATKNTYGLVIGAALGHGCCTMLAVTSGKIVASILSVRFVTVVGGILLMFFSLSIVWSNI